MSDVVIELHAAGYADMDLGASVRATSCTFYLDVRPQTLRVLLRVGVFVAGPGRLTLALAHTQTQAPTLTQALALTPTPNPNPNPNPRPNPNTKP